MNSNNNRTHQNSKDSPSGGSMNNNRMDSYFFQLFSNHILDGKGDGGSSSGGAPPNGTSTATTTTTTTTTTTHATQDEQAQKLSTPPPNQNTVRPRLQPTTTSTTTTTASTSSALFQDSDDDDDEEDDDDDANDAEKLRLLNEIERLRRSNHELEEEIMIFRDDVMFQFDDADVSACVGQEQDEQGNPKTWIGFIAADSNDQLLLMTDHLREQLGVDKLRVRDYHWSDLMQSLSTTADKSDPHSSSSRQSPHLNTMINWDQLSVFPLQNHLNNNISGNNTNTTNYNYSRFQNGGGNSFCYLGAFRLRHLNSENNRASIVQCKKAIRRMTYSNTMSSGSPQQSNNHNTTSPPLCYSMTKLYYFASR